MFRNYGIDPVIVVISRKEIEAGDTSAVVGTLKTFCSSREKIASSFELLDVVFSGYDGHRDEVFEIPEVRDFVHKLDNEFPFWLYFLRKTGTGLLAIALCFLPPFLTEEAKKTILPARLGDLLMKRWFPAMNQICEIAGFSEDRIERLSDSVADYFTNGPQ